ncbi:MAG: elongation factor G [bacterium]|nr:elongation factor G [bacterium]MBU1917979.1 elongation factor G [bacterium]
MKDIALARNIGISAHIDSGKTTLTERILFYSGKIHRIAEVRGKDGVGAKMDSMELEREKGITIQSAATHVDWKDHGINIIDTPGHVDFTVEVERALRVLDGAVLVLCGVAGVQSQSLTVTRQMNRYKVPRIAFINKLDRQGANPLRVIEQLKEKLDLNAHPLCLPIGLEDKIQGVIDLLEMKAVYFLGENGENVTRQDIPENFRAEAEEWHDKLIEEVANVDDEIADLFLEGRPVTKEDLMAAIRRATLAHKFIPVYMGTAFKNKGVQLLLDAICNFMPSPNQIQHTALNIDNNEEEVALTSEDEKPLVALSFKLEDGRYGQLTYMRIYQGTMAKGDIIFNTRTNRKIKIPRLVRMHADEMHDIKEAGAGDIVAIFGVDCVTGDTFCHNDIRYSMSSMHIPETVIDLAISPKLRETTDSFSKALNRFTKEDPTFKVRYDEESSQTIISGMGELHLQVYVERIRREYACEVDIGKPQVAYRETITKPIDCEYLHKKQTGGSGQYAYIMAKMEPIPLEETTHYDFVNSTVGGSIPKEYIPSCDKGFQKAMRQGQILEQPVVGVRMSIYDGKYHPVDSSDMAFQICAETLFKDNYFRAKPIVLEPVMKLEVTVPNEFQGAATALINQRRSIIMSTMNEHGFTTVEAEAPLAAMFGFSTDIRSVTQGKGEFTLEFLKYSPVPKQLQEDLIKQECEEKKNAA